MDHRIYVTRPSMPPMEEYVGHLREIWESRQLTNMGPKHEELREKLKAFLGVPELELVVNGHMALELTLQAMHLEGKVITTPFTFPSTTYAILRCGLTPVFCDIDPETFTLDPQRIEALITKNTCAILPVHVFGHVCAVEEIQRIAKKHGLPVIYDACQAFGVRYKGRGIGTFGEASCFSFHATKVFQTVEGGAICHHDRRLGRKIQGLRNFGIRDEETVDVIGGNAKMNELCAAMGLCSLAHIEEEIEKRKLRAERYRECLGGIAGLQVPLEQGEVSGNYGYFTILIDPEAFGADRDAVCAALREEGIVARRYFYPLTSEHVSRGGVALGKETPSAQRVSRRILCLPLYADLALEDVERICGAVRKCRVPQPSICTSSHSN